MERGPNGAEAMSFSCDETRRVIGIGYFMKAANERGTQNLVKLSNCWATSGAEPAVRKSYKTVHKKRTVIVTAL